MDPTRPVARKTNWKHQSIYTVQVIMYFKKSTQVALKPFETFLQHSGTSNMIFGKKSVKQRVNGRLTDTISYVHQSIQ